MITYQPNQPVSLNKVYLKENMPLINKCQEKQNCLLPIFNEVLLQLIL